MSDETMRRGLSRYLRGGMAGFSFDELIEIHHKTAQHLYQTNNPEFSLYRVLGYDKYYAYKEGKLFVLYSKIWHRVKTLQYFSADSVNVITPKCLHTIFSKHNLYPIDRVIRNAFFCQRCAHDVNRPL